MQKCYWFHKIVTIIEKCSLCLFAIERFFYETMTMTPTVLRNSARYREMHFLKHFRYREVTLYFEI